MKFKPFNFPTSPNVEAAISAVRELSENCQLRPAPKVLGCRPWREFVLVPIPAASRIVTWHPSAISQLPSAISQLPSPI